MGLDAGVKRWNKPPTVSVTPVAVLPTVLLTPPMADSRDVGQLMIRYSSFKLSNGNKSLTGGQEPSLRFSSGMLSDLVWISRVVLGMLMICIGS